MVSSANFVYVPLLLCLVNVVHLTNLDCLQGKGEDQTNRGRQYLTEEYFPAERRDQWIWRGKKVIAECQSHNDYQESVRWLIDFVQTYTKHGTAMAGSANNNAKDAGAHDAAEKAFKTTAQVLDRFADGKSVENLLWKPIKQILEDAQKDEELRNWINEFGDYVKDVSALCSFVPIGRC